MAVQPVLCSISLRCNYTKGGTEPKCEPKRVLPDSKKDQGVTKRQTKFSKQNDTRLPKHKKG